MILMYLPFCVGSVRHTCGFEGGNGDAGVSGWKIQHRASGGPPAASPRPGRGGGDGGSGRRGARAEAESRSPKVRDRAEGASRGERARRGERASAARASPGAFARATRAPTFRYPNIAPKARGGAGGLDRARRGSGEAHLSDEVQHDVLQDVTPVGHLLEVRHEERYRAVLGVVVQHEEGVATGGEIGLATAEESLDGLGGVLEQHVSAGHLVDAVHAHHRVASDERVAVLEARHDGGDEGLEDLRLGDSAEEPERGAAQELVRMLQVVAQVLADEDHLGEDLAALVRLLDDLHVQKQELLHILVVAGKDEAHDGDENLRHLLAGEQDGDGLLHRLRLLVRAPGLERLLDLGGARRTVEVHEH